MASDLGATPAGGAVEAQEGEVSPATAPKVLDLNLATAEELTGLPGIGRKKAEAIVALRNRRPFSRPTQLLLVKGIGQKTLLKLMPLVRVGPPQGASAPGGHPELKERQGVEAARRAQVRGPSRPGSQAVGPGQGPPAP